MRAFSSGKTSTIGRTPVKTLKLIAFFISLISVKVPLTEPELFRKSKLDQPMFSSLTAAIITSPPFCKPAINGEIAFGFGAVAIMTFAPPNFCKVSAIFSVSESI